MLMSVCPFMWHKFFKSSQSSSFQVREQLVHSESTPIIYFLKLFIIRFNFSHFQLQSCLLCSHLLYPPPYHGRLLSADGTKALGTKTHWRGHTQSGKVQKDQTKGTFFKFILTYTRQIVSIAQHLLFPPFSPSFVTQLKKNLSLECKLFWGQVML